MKTNSFLKAAWLISIFATFMSVFIGEILHYEPCPLCWYQRICLFPLVLLLAVGVLRREKLVALYAMPQVIVGVFLAFYQFIYPKVLPLLGIIPICTFEKDCSDSPFELFGFINLAFLSLLLFLTILVLLILSYFQKENRID